jgi:hypothetical protein
VIVDRPGAAQTEIRVGNIALPRRHPDYLALDVALKILGGEGGNRLHRVLRSERGLTYGASADLNALKDTGDIVAETDTRSEKTAEALRLIVEEIVRLQRQRVQQRELSDAQEYLTGSFPLTVETPSAIALQVLNAVFYGLDLNELQTYRDRVNRITVDDIQRVAQQYLHPDKLSIVLVGDASVFAKDLPGVGFDQVERISASDLDLASPDLRRRSAPRPGGIEPIAFHYRPTGATVGQGMDPDVRALVDRAVAAKGGLALLRSIQTVRASSVTTLVTDAGAAKLPTITTIRYPAAFRLETTTPTGRLIQVFNAGSYWYQDEKGVHEAPPSMQTQIRGSIQRDLIPLLLALTDGKIAATRSDTVEAGKTVPGLKVALPGASALTLIFDPATTLVAKARYDLEAAPGTTIPVEETYSDYRDVKGLKVAFSLDWRRDGAPPVNRTVRTFEFNVPVDATLFTRPS